ncbi:MULTISPECIES: hypothetical protein [Chromobacterium]|uniref:Uncharacterized protein n=2 Tax=Chromobacterium TaxID=535 RepID=A0ABS3GNU7_9NEIS|nr:MULTISPECIES: hypothetical protein [Chromobacterium]AXT47783.1 hypothetical protein D1345_17100 [Chromobacterium rhizoryzae]MBK0415352.1 hypothetical protein [Chromobacterium haemolyticum]MBO0416733.1 hypothetical protein [Chromobacterium haemolyticum]MBO0500079.1 hypothetical protein [Chromobacterium haemolyticum]MDH0341201.1 hypothetical protein [Chromobacterium haemolyticum]
MSQTLPPRRFYRLKPHENQATQLPFVRYLPHRGQPHHWQMPPADDYVDACAYGRECAAHLAQFFKDQPHRLNQGLLGKIARDVDFKDPGHARGYWVGFFSYAEQLMALGALRCDVYAHVDSVHALQQAQTQKSELEGKAPSRNS